MSRPTKSNPQVPPSRADLKLNARGFAEYGSGTCTHDIAWRLVESSIAGDPHAYLFSTGTLEGGRDAGGHKVDGSLHLNVEQAKELIAHLQRFVRDAEDSAHWKNEPGYIDVWRSEEGPEQP